MQIARLTRMRLSGCVSSCRATNAKAEAAAALDSGGVWEVLLLAPLGMQKFRREAPDRWRLVETGKGFA